MDTACPNKNICPSTITYLPELLKRNHEYAQRIGAVTGDSGVCRSDFQSGKDLADGDIAVPVGGILAAGPGTVGENDGEGPFLGRSRGYSGSIRHDFGAIGG